MTSVACGPKLTSLFLPRGDVIRVLPESKRSTKWNLNYVLNTKCYLLITTICLFQFAGPPGPRVE